MTDWLLIAVICSDLACMALPPERHATRKLCDERLKEIGREYMAVGMIVKKEECRPALAPARTHPAIPPKGRD